jgi:hypothetical protein
MSDERKHPHYFKPCPFDDVDIYRVLSMFGVTDPCLQHAIKKLLVAGQRGAKADAGWTVEKDVQEAIDTLLRFQEMRREEANVAKPLVVSISVDDGQFSGEVRRVIEDAAAIVASHHTGGFPKATP